MRRSPSGNSDALATNHSAIPCSPCNLLRQYRSAAPRPTGVPPFARRTRLCNCAGSSYSLPQETREDSMADAQTEPKLLLPFLQPFYDAVQPLSWLIIRVAVGWNLFIHGWNKLLLGPAPNVVKNYAEMNFNPPELW